MFLCISVSPLHWIPFLFSSVFSSCVSFFVRMSIWFPGSYLCISVSSSWLSFLLEGDISCVCVIVGCLIVASALCNACMILPSYAVWPLSAKYCLLTTIISLSRLFLLHVYQPHTFEQHSATGRYMIEKGNSRAYYINNNSEHRFYHKKRMEGKPAYIRAPGIEPGIFCVLGRRHSH